MRVLGALAASRRPSPVVLGSPSPSLRRGKAVASAVACILETLEARINFGYFSADPLDEQPVPTDPECQSAPTPVASSNGGFGSDGGVPAASQTTAPIQNFNGLPNISGADLSSANFGTNWGYTRSWSGLNNASLNGNGWTVMELPYVVVAGGTNGASGPGVPTGTTGVLTGTEDDDRLTVVAGGLSGFTFSVPTSAPYTSFAARGAGNVTLESTIDDDSDRVLRMTDAVGNVTDFYDVSRDGNDRPIAATRANVAARYGQFKRYTSADGSTTIETSYSDGTAPGYPDGYLMAVTRRDVGGAAVERYAFSYAQVTNSYVPSGSEPYLIAEVDLQRYDGSAWQTARKVDYTYYTGELSGGGDDPNGRLGDLKLAEVKDPLGNVIDTSYYRYYKFTGESHLTVTSSGPTNNLATTRGPAALQPPVEYSSDGFVQSGLKTVVEGAAFDRLKSTYPASYATASDAQIEPYVNHYFEYERWGDHEGLGAGDNGRWRMGYRLGTRYRVTTEIAQGDGCSTCSGGQGTYKYEYVASYDETGIGFNSIERNVWRMRTTEFLPDTTPSWGDNDRRVVYTNEAGQTMLEILVDVDTATVSVDDVTDESTTAAFTMEVTTATPHGFTTDDVVAIAGASDARYNGVFAITVTGTNKFTIFIPYYPLGYLPEATGGPITVAKVLSQSRTFYKYDDDDGRMIMKAEPSAVVEHYEWSPDLVNSYPGGNYEGISDDEGLIHVYTYFDGTTTANTTAAGNVDGYLQSTGVRRGESGTLVPLTAQNYIAHADGNGVTVYKVASTTSYFDSTNDGVDDANVTSYSYSWYGTSNRVKEISTARPIISTSNNGPGGSTHDTDAVFYDTYDRPIWTKDAAGHVAYMAYDVMTGAVVKSIVDVEYSSLTLAEQTSFGNTGWAQPASGLHLITVYEVDLLGRTTKETDPNGKDTFTTYKDAEREVRVYRGWHQSGSYYGPTGPVEVAREYRSGTPTSGIGRVYFETLAVSFPANFTGSEPDGSEAIDSSTIQSLTRSLTNNAGQVLEVDAYFSLAGVTYSRTSPWLGTDSNDSSSGNYHATRQAYGDRGRLKRTASPTGTVTRYAYDARGNVVQVWIGTDDVDNDTTGGELFWSPAAASDAEFNLVKVESREYDTSGNMIQVTQHPGSGVADRETRIYYDWRNRPVIVDAGVASTITGVDRQIRYVRYNNQDQIIAQERYAGDDQPITTTDGDPDAPSLSLRRSRTTTSYDEQGRVYRSEVFNVSPTAGTVVGSYSLRTDTYYDRRGHLIETRVPGGLVTEIEYDGAGRAVRVYQSDGAGGSGYTFAGNATGDHVLAQTDYTYDGNGNVILTVSRERFHDATATGELGDKEGHVNGSGTYAAARVYFTASYYDAANRKTADVNLGTNGGDAYTRPSSAPSRTGATDRVSFGDDEVQTVTLTGTPTGGTFTLGFGGASTGAIAYNASVSTVQAALQGLSTIGSGNVSVGGSPGAWTVTFQANLARTNVPQLTTTASLTGGTSPAVTVSTTTQGLGGLITSYAYAANEVQGLRLTGGPTGGTFTLSLAGQTTSAIAYNASASAVDSALEALSNVGTDNVTVTGSYTAGYAITFVGSLAGLNLAQLTATASLTGGSSPAALVSTAVDGQTGRLTSVTDPRGIESRTSYDLLGRTTRTVAAFADGLPGGADDQTTQYMYDGSDHVLTMKAVLPGNGSQETRYVYGEQAVASFAHSGTTATVAAARHGFRVGQTVVIRGAGDDAYNGTFTVTAVTANTFSYVMAGAPIASGGSDGKVRPATQIFSNDLLTAVQYSDKSSGSASSSEQDTFTYNALGEKITYTDRNGTTHAYSYDVFGRLRLDNVTTLGSGVDGRIRGLAYRYDSAGRASEFASLEIVQAGGTLSRSGTTVTVTLSGHSFSVGDDVLIDGGTQPAYNGVYRVTAIGSGTFEFAVSSTLASTLPASASGFTAARVVNQVTRAYNGLGQLTAEYQEHNGAVDGSTPAVLYAYSEMSGGANHSRLEMVTYPNGRKLHYGYATGIDSATSRVSFLADDNGAGGIGSHVEDYKYLGLATAVERVRPEPTMTYALYVGASGVSVDGGDRYVGLDRFGRVVDQHWAVIGDPDIVSSPDRVQYGYDANGNVRWRTGAGGGIYDYDDLNRLTGYDRGTVNSTRTGLTGSATLALDWALDAAGNWDGTDVNGVPTDPRLNNAQNQIVDIDGNTVAYDEDGNLTSDESRERSYTYDAWNRLATFARVGEAGGTYAYDALGRRLTEGDGSPSTHLYYSDQWQVMEERDPGGTTTAQYVWSPTHVDAMVLRDADADANTATGALGKSSSGLEQRLYVQQDANWNVTSLYADTATVEYFVYDPYGGMTVVDPSSGVVSESNYGWRYQFQGHRFDAAADLYDFRHRAYDPALGRFLQQDPTGYVDGANLYEAFRSNSLVYADPLGLRVELPWDDYYDQFKKDHPGLTPEQLKWAEEQLARGCVGVTCANLGRIAPKTNCFKTRAQAEQALKKEKCDNGNKGCGLYSIHLWSDPNNPVVTFDPNTGQADLNEWKNVGRPPGDWNRDTWVDWDKDGKPDPTTGVNFDYGYVGPDGMIWHADMYHNPDRNGDLTGDYWAGKDIRNATVYGSSNKEWARSNLDFNTEVWCTACKGDYK